MVRYYALRREAKDTIRSKDTKGMIKFISRKQLDNAMDNKQKLQKCKQHSTKLNLKV